jgi:hypothetical protein
MRPRSTSSSTTARGLKKGVQLLAEQVFRHLGLEHDAALLRDADAVIFPAARTFPHEEHMAAAPRLRVCSMRRAVTSGSMWTRRLGTGSWYVPRLAESARRWSRTSRRA